MAERSETTELTGLLADADVQGHFDLLTAICRGPQWHDYWTALSVRVWSLYDLHLPGDAPDVEIWETCQRRGRILITGNRNAEDETSLEATIRTRNTGSSLPVITLANRDRILSDPHYAERVAIRLMELLSDIDSLRGSGRLWLP